MSLVGNTNGEKPPGAGQLGGEEPEEKSSQVVGSPEGSQGELQSTLAEQNDTSSVTQPPNSDPINNTVQSSSTGVVDEAMTYAGLVYYEQKGVEDLVTFTAAKDLNILLKFLEKKRPNAEIGPNIYFRFKDDPDGYIELQFGTPQEEPITGWTITPYTVPCRIYQDDIDLFGSEDYPIPPTCLISVYGSPDAVPSLHYGIPLKGVTDPVTILINRSLINYVSYPLSAQDLKFFQGALKEGSITSYVTKVLIQGEARVGKTSVKCMLVSEEYDKKSTGCFDASTVAVHKVDDEEKKQSSSMSFTCYEKKKERYWKKMTDHEIEEDVLCALNFIAKNTSKPHNISYANDNKSKIDPTNTKEKSLAKGINSPESSQAATATDIKHTATSEIITKVRGLYDKAKNQKDTPVLHNEWHQLYFIDSGGQIQFQKLLPAFMPCASVVILVVNLAKNLNDPASQDYQPDSHSDAIALTCHSMTVEEVIKHLFSAISSIAQQHKSLITELGLSEYIVPPKDNKLKVVTVGTHCDEYLQGQVELISNKKASLVKYFDVLSESCTLIKEKGSFKLYTIDGSKANDVDHDDPEVGEVAKIIDGNSFELKIPLRWYCFDVLLRKIGEEGCGVLSIQECNQLGQELSGMSPEEVKSALQFLHFLNKILYYPNVKSVSDFVFVKVESLINIIRELVELACTSSKDKLKEPKSFILQGKLSCDIIKELEHFEKIHQKLKDFTEDKLLELFRYLLIATKDDFEGTTFTLPALLPAKDVSNIDIFPSTVPLLFYFKNSVPMGLFCALIVQLLSFDELEWNVINPHGLPNCSNYFNLSLRKGDYQVVLVEQLHCIEVYSDTPNKLIADTIENAIKSSIKAHRLALNDETFKKEFKCPCTSPPEDPHSLKIEVTEDGNNYYYTCERSSMQPKELKNELYQVWLEEKPDAGITNSIASGTSSARAYIGSIAHQVLTENISQISHCQIDLNDFAIKFLEKRIISENQRRQVLDMMTRSTTDERMNELIDALISTVKVDSSIFGWFIQLLKDYDTRLTHNTADTLIAKYNELATMKRKQ